MMTSYGHGKKIYSDLIRLFTEHLKNIKWTKEIFLATLHTAWNDYTNSLKMILDVFMYMDKVYARVQKESIINLGFKWFGDTVIR